MEQAQSPTVARKPGPKPPSAEKEKMMVKAHQEWTDKTTQEIADFFQVSKATYYKILNKHGVFNPVPAPDAPAAESQEGAA